MQRINDEKKKLRATLREERSGVSASSPEAALALRDVFLASVKLPENAIIATYTALGGEMNPAPLEEALITKGHLFCLPCIEARGTPLVFRAYVDGDPLCLGYLDIPEPLTTSPVLEPDVLLVPLMGFDHSGTRLGQGGGYYDRTLASLRQRKKILAIGLAFEAQERPGLPAAAHDERLDLIVTEKSIIDPVS